MNGTKNEIYMSDLFISGAGKDDPILSPLNDKQRIAALTTEGYVRVIAGAGSGKTRALTHRYAYIVSGLGISPSNVLCLTFTNKAAGEMRKRVRSLLGEDADTSLITTIHSFCASVLREDVSKVFYPESFIILDNTDQKKILEEVYDELGLRLDTASFQKMLDKMEVYKGTLKYMDYVADPSFDMKSLTPSDTDEAVILRYIEKQKKYFALDFADLLDFVLYIFNTHPDVLDKWQERMCYVQVDEFQDVDEQEYTLIKLLSGKNHNLFVVGDPDQNIYEWRGAKMRIIIDFDKQQTPCKTVVFDRNYRSTPEILAPCNSLIARNQHRIRKTLVAENGSGEPAEHYHGKSEEDEIRYIVSKINSRLERGGAYSDNAVLYRSSYVSRFIEQGFMKYNIPYTVVGGLGFYERSEIKDVIAYMRLVSAGDDLSFKRVVNLPRRRIGKLKQEYIARCAEREKTTLYEALKNHVSDGIFASSGAAEFVKVIESLKARKDDAQVSELLQRILKETGYEYYLRENGDMDRLDNVTELLQSIYSLEREFGEEYTLPLFLQSAALIPDPEQGDKKDKVKIMTVHVAKGLEFENVFIAGMNETVFPSQRALESRGRDALEEERRLAFVAMTRAKKTLVITESEGMTVRGGAKVPSRFFADIGEDCLKQTGYPIKEPYKRSDAPSRDLSSERKFKDGAKVFHRVFGMGVIESSDEEKGIYFVRFDTLCKPISFSFQGLVAL